MKKYIVLDEPPQGGGVLSRTALMLALVLAILPLAGCGDMEDYPNATAVFRATFEVVPPKEVTNLQAYGRVYGDNSACHLRFNAPYATVKALVGKSFEEVLQVSYTISMSHVDVSGPKRAWWAPPLNATSKYFSSEVFHPHFSSGQAYLAYDSATQLVHFYWDGWD